MKRFLTLLLCLLLPLTALAEMDADGDIVVTLEGAEFFFTPLENSICLTRESSASVFNQLGMSQREMIPYMEAYGVYALLFDVELSTEMQVLASETVETDFDALTAFGETRMCESFHSYYVDQGLEVTSVEIYDAPDGHKFVRTIAAYRHADGTEEPMIEYLTCQAGYSVTIVVFPYEGGVTQAQIDRGNALADSVWVTPSLP